MNLLILLAASWLAGTAFVRWLRPVAGAERETFRIVAGLGLSGLVALPVATVSFGWGTAALFVLAVAGGALTLRMKPLPQSKTPSTRLELLDRLLAATPLAALVLALPAALAPETAWDATASHIALAQEYAAAQCIRISSHNLQSAYPHLLHTLYTYAFSAAGERGVHLVSLLFAAAGCGAAFSLGRRLGNRRSGLLAAAFFSTMPLFFDQAGKALLDIPFAACILLVATCFAGWQRTGRVRWLGAAGLLLAVSCGIRHTGFVAGGIFFLLSPFWRKRVDLRAALFFALAAGFGAAPQIVRNIALSGTPLYPFLLGWFPASHLPSMADTAVGGHSSRQSLDMLAALTFPWSLVAHPDAYDGWNASPGPWALVLGVPALFLGSRPMKLTGAFGVLGTMVFYFFQHYARYAAPFLAPMACAGAALPSKRPWLTRGIYAPALLICAAGLGLGALMNAPRLPVALGLQSRSAYLEERIERYAALRKTGRFLEPEGRILALDPRYYFIDAPASVNFHFLHGIRGKPVPRQVQALYDAGIRYVMYPADYIERSRGHIFDGLTLQCARWRTHPQAFQPVRAFLTRRRSGRAGKEWVIIYALSPPRREVACGAAPS